MKFLFDIYKTALHIATINNNFETVKLLLKHPNIDVNAKYIYKFYF